MTDEIQARIDAARARRAVQDKAAAERTKARERQIDADLETAVADATDKLGELDKDFSVVIAKYAGGGRAGFVIVKRCEIEQWRAFRAKMQKAKGVEIETAQENLWRPNVIAPDLAKVDSLIAELPFLSELLGDAIGRLCGIRVEDLQGK